MDFRSPLYKKFLLILLSGCALQNNIITKSYADFVVLLKFEHAKNEFSLDKEEYTLCGET